MRLPLTGIQITIRKLLIAAAIGVLLLAGIALFVWYRRSKPAAAGPFRFVTTIAGPGADIGEPYGMVSRGNIIYFTDGLGGRIWRIDGDLPTVFANGFDTPSEIAVDKAGGFVVADSGSDTIRSVDAKGSVTTIAGVTGRSGFTDGRAATALFNAPIGVAVDQAGKIFVADTYNDRIRVIENGNVSTLAGGDRGYADGMGGNAKFDTPCGLAIWRDKLLVADMGNRRIRVVEQNGNVWTLAGTGETDLRDGLLSSASFVEPAAVTVDGDGTIYIADGNAIRQIGGDFVPVVSTISGESRGLRDGAASTSRFNRPSGFAFDAVGDLIVADSENRLIRRFSRVKKGHEITPAEIAGLLENPAVFRGLQPPRWPYDPPAAKRDIAGTLGEIRGDIPETEAPARFHNGLDIAGSYGETARFVRDDKVLDPIAADGFGTLRESIRLPETGYIHIRLGRNVSSVPFGDGRFQFERDTIGKIIGVRIPRGTKFKAGEPIGTLNPMNHVHLIAGRSGSEMNALDALIFPNLTDSRPPVIEKLSLFDENWHELETGTANSRIKLTGKTRIVCRAYDQADGNSDRRRLGVYRLGYQILKADGLAATETKWTLTFDRFPSPRAVSLVYAAGSKSGATGETIFNYIVTNFVHGDEYYDDTFDPRLLGDGKYTIRVFAADYFGNIAQRDVPIEVLK